MSRTNNTTPATAIDPVCPEWRLKISILIVSSVMFGFSQVSEKTRTSYASASLRVMSIFGDNALYVHEENTQVM